MKPAEYRALKFASGKERHCWMCGCPLTFATSTVDHLIPKSSKKASWSQKNSAQNYRLACSKCNSTRGNKRLTKDQIKAAKGFKKGEKKYQQVIDAHQKISQTMRAQSSESTQSQHTEVSDPDIND